MSVASQFPDIGSPFVEKDGRIAVPWLRLLQAIWLNQGASAGGSTADIQFLAQTDLEQLDDALQAQDDMRALQALEVEDDRNAWGAPLAPVTVGASPFSYVASASGIVSVTAGTVSAIAFSRDAVNFFQVAAATNAACPVMRGDTVRVTYTVAPTLKMVAMQWR